MVQTNHSVSHSPPNNLQFMDRKTWWLWGTFGLHQHQQHQQSSEKQAAVTALLRMTLRDIFALPQQECFHIYAMAIKLCSM